MTDMPDHHGWKLVNDRKYLCVDVLHQCAVKIGPFQNRPCTTNDEVRARLAFIESKGFIFILPGSERRARV